MEEEKYNGWTNKETWTINLHLTNTEDIYKEVQELLKQEYEYKHFKEDALKDYVEDLIITGNEDGILLLRTDLLTDALSRVNWGEIVKGFEEE